MTCYAQDKHNKSVSLRYTDLTLCLPVVSRMLQLEMLTSKVYALHKSAQEAYKGFVRAYASHKEKRCFDVEKLDLKAVAKSFGFAVPPYVDLSILFAVAYCLSYSSVPPACYMLSTGSAAS